MRSDQTRLALYDIRDNAKFAQDFVAGISFERFRDDRLFFYAVTRALEIISEAARRLPTDLRDRHPELPWRAIMGVGNVYRHNYDTVAEEYVWRTVHDSLPALLAVIEAEIGRLDDYDDEVCCTALTRNWDIAIYLTDLPVMVVLSIPIRRRRSVLRARLRSRDHAAAQARPLS